MGLNKKKAVLQYPFAMIGRPGALNKYSAKISQLTVFIYFLQNQARPGCKNY